MKKFLLLLTASCLTTVLQAACPLDHFLIGRNPDGINGTDDDLKLYVDTTQKYRHSDPANSGDSTWLNWYYPMYYSTRSQRFSIGEPGFDLLANDPNHQLIGTASIDYSLIIECVDISEGFRAREPYGTFTLDEAGDSFCHSELSDPHVHVSYQLPWPSGTNDPNETYWITYQIYDNLEDDNMYEASDTFTVVFLNKPIAGDIHVDRVVDILDLEKLAWFWLQASNQTQLNADGLAAIDYFDGADINRDYQVNLSDFVWIAYNWLLIE